jgi:hypothetical protein
LPFLQQDFSSPLVHEAAAVPLPLLQHEPAGFSVSATFSVFSFGSFFVASVVWALIAKEKNAIRENNANTFFIVVMIFL